MMRTVTIKHRNGLGERTYRIYESIEQLKETEPEASVSNKLSEAEEGDYVVSKNGWVVPLIRKTRLVNKYYKRGGRRYKRRVEYTHTVYHFPHQRVCVSEKRLEAAEFNYKPKDSKNIASEGKRNRMYELSSRKIQWAQLVARGYDPKLATQEVYPRVMNKNRLTKSLLLNDKIIEYIESKANGGRKKYLKSIGMSVEEYIKYIKEIIEDKQSAPKLRIFALELVYKILSSN
jgi:hypothetical protein